MCVCVCVCVKWLSGICTDEETEAQMLKDLTKDAHGKWWDMDVKLAVEL